MASFNFNAANVAPQQSFAPIPAGSYIAQVVESEIKPTKNGTGQMMNLTFEVLDGQYKNRKVFGRINVVNQSAEAERIGQSQLSALCHATGVMQLQDTVQLHNKPIKIKVKVRVDESGKYDDSNEVTGYEAISGAVQIPAASQQAQAAPAAPSASAAPWARRAAA